MNTSQNQSSSQLNEKEKQSLIEQLKTFIDEQSHGVIALATLFFFLAIPFGIYNQSQPEHLRGKDVITPSVTANTATPTATAIALEQE